MPIDHAERERRRALLAAHYDAENDHDLDRIMATFSAGGEMIYNGQLFADPESIRQGHTYIGFTGAGGAFGGLVTTRDREHFTADEIVVEGRLCGRTAASFRDSRRGRQVELPFIAFYNFARNGLLVSERVVMNLAPLAQAS